MNVCTGFRFSFQKEVRSNWAIETVAPKAQTMFARPGVKRMDADCHLGTPIRNFNLTLPIPVHLISGFLESYTFRLQFAAIGLL